MNGSPISTEDRRVCVCLCATTGAYLASSRCQTGSQPCICGKIWRYDYGLPRPHSKAQGKFPSTFSKVMFHWKVESFDGKNKKQINEVKRQGMDKMRASHTKSVGVWHQTSKLDTPVTQQLWCCGNIEIECPIGQCHSLAASSTSSIWTRLTSKHQRSQAHGQKHERWTWEQAQRIVVRTHSLIFQMGTLKAFLLWWHLFWERRAYLLDWSSDEKISNLILATAAALIPSYETEPECFSWVCYIHFRWRRKKKHADTQNLSIPSTERF